MARPARAAALLWKSLAIEIPVSIQSLPEFSSALSRICAISANHSGAASTSLRHLHTSTTHDGHVMIGVQARSFRSSPYFRQELPGGAGASTRGGGRPLDANNISADEQHPAAASAADEPADAAKAEPRDKAGSSAATPARSVHSPLQSLMDAAAAGSEPALSGGARPAVPLPRTWAWYDAEDEREEQRRERKGLAERYADAGLALRVNAEQSIKKMNRVIKLIRGLPYEEAVYQCRLQPRKAARILLECLEHAHKDAEEKGLDASKLVVATIFATKGQYEKKMRPMGRGYMSAEHARRSHLTLALRESREPQRTHAAVASMLLGPIGRGTRAPRGMAFGVRQVAPATEHLPRLRPRFAYAVEV